MRMRNFRFRDLFGKEWEYRLLISRRFDQLWDLLSVHSDWNKMRLKFDPRSMKWKAGMWR